MRLSVQTDRPSTLYTLRIRIWQPVRQSKDGVDGVDCNCTGIEDDAVFYSVHDGYKVAHLALLVFGNKQQIQIKV